MNTILLPPLYAGASTSGANRPLHPTHAWTGTAGSTFSSAIRPPISQTWAGELGREPTNLEMGRDQYGQPTTMSMSALQQAMPQPRTEAEGDLTTGVGSTEPSRLPSGTSNEMTQLESQQSYPGCSLEDNYGGNVIPEHTSINRDTQQKSIASRESKSGAASTPRQAIEQLYANHFRVTINTNSIPVYRYQIMHESQNPELAWYLVYV